MNRKELELLAKEVYPERFEERLKETQEQIKQLKEPISQDKVTGDAPDRWSELTDRVEKAEALATDRLELLRRCKGWLENYLDYLDTDIPLLGEPNNTVASLIDELTKELGDD